MSISAAQRTRLGAFVVIGGVLLCLFAAIPAGLRLSDRHKTYYAHFEGESLSGLEDGATVKFHGVAIGKVTAISYDPANLSRVKVTMKIQADFPMKVDMYAQTGMLGITGLMYVEILGGTNQAALLKDGVEIRTKQSMIATITGKAEGIVAKVELLLNHLNRISDPDTLKSVKQILDNVAVITTDARHFMDNVRPNMEHVSGSAQNVLTMLDSISRDVKILTGELRKTVQSGEMSSIMVSADSTARSLKELTQNFNLTLKQTREDITVTMRNLREASESANELAKVLAENPSLLLKGDQQKERAIR